MHISRIRAGLLATTICLGGALPALTATSASADTPLPPDCVEKAYPGFGSAGDLTLNGRAAVVNTGDGSVLRVTNNGFSGAGSAFTTQKAALHDGGSFSTAFSFRASGQAGGGADGLVFTVQNVDNNVGSIGGGLGYQGIPQSIGVEFDDWFNGGYDSDDNHVGIDVNGDINSVRRQNLAPINIDAGQRIYVWVDYDGSANQLEVRVASTATRPTAANLSYGINLPATLGGSGAPAEDAFLGFTSATGAAAANFDVIDWSFRNCYQPVGVDTSPTADAGGPYAGHLGDPVALDGTVADDTVGLTQAWTASGPGTCTFADDTAADTTVSCSAKGAYTLTLTATDSIGQTAVDTADLTIANRAPVAGALDLSATTGCTVDATLHFTDGDPGDSHTVGFSWGDGATSAGTVDETSGTGSGTHTFAHAGTYTVAATVSDGTDSGSTSASYTTKNTAGAFQQPINAGGDRSVFKLGSTIPVKITVTDCDGARVGTLSPVLSLVKLDATSPTTVTETPVDVVATNGRAMTWMGDRYQFNLSTKRSQFNNGADLSVGTYRLSVSDPTLVSPATVRIDLR